RLRRCRAAPLGHHRHRKVRRVRGTREGVGHCPEPSVRAQEGWMTDTMRAIVLDAPGPPDVLTIREHPVPTPNREAPPAANVEATRRLPVAPQPAEARGVGRL